jgi:hypothetical protein
MKTIQKVVAFLIFTVGIVYIVWWITSICRIKEGFQGTRQPCTTITSRGTSLYLCNDRTLADEQVLINFSATPIIKVPVCYTNNNTLNYTATNSKIYTCYDPNGDAVFDDSMGVFQPFNPILDMDPMAGYGEQDAIMNYTSLKAGYPTLSTAFLNMKNINNIISPITYSHINTNLTKLNQLSNTHCTGIDSSSSKYIICQNLAVAIQTINDYKGDRGVDSLSNISTVTNKSFIAVSNIFYGENGFLKSFYNSHVLNPAQVAELQSPTH